MLVAAAIGLFGGAAGLYATLKGPKKLKNCYLQPIPFQRQNGTLVCTGTQIGNVCYSAPLIANAQNECTAIAFATVEPNYSPTVQSNLGLQAPYIALDGTSTTLSIPSVTPQITCTCLDSGPFPRTGSATTSNCVKMRCTTLYEGQLYMEAAGGTGASITYYTDTNVAPVSYAGGTPGMVYGTVSVKPNDTFDISFGYNASPANAASIAEGVQQVVPGNGGLASLLGGSNGGGCTVVTKGNTVPVADTRSSSAPLLVAPGGGGAGRNGAGGNAGSPGPYKYLEVPSQVTHGLNGQSVIDPNNDPVYAKPSPVTLSGEGGSSKGGMSLDPNGTGSFLQGGNASDFLSSGGGGGAGFFGGGSGFTNGLSKPNNVQGAGGGGSSFSSMQLSSVPYIRKNLGATSTYITFGYPSA